jgi:hypothetical protein
LHLAWQQPKDVTNGDVILIVLQTVNRYLKDCCCLVSSLLREIFVKKKQSSFHRCVVCLLLLPLALSLGPLASFADAATVTLGWDANSEPDLEGYVIYRNTGDLTDPLHPKITLTGLNEGQEHYIALTAYNTEGVESNFSNDVCVEVAGGSAGVCANRSNSVSSNTGSSYSGGGGGSSNACFISNAGYDSSTFSKFVAQPVIRTQGLAMLLLLLVFIAAVKFVINRTKGK